MYTPERNFGQVMQFEPSYRVLPSAKAVQASN